MRLAAALAALLWASSAWAQSNSLVSTVLNAPTAATPGAPGDYFLVIESGLVKKTTGVSISTASGQNLTTSPLATLPLGTPDSLLVVQGSAVTRVPGTSPFNWDIMSARAFQAGSGGVTLSSGGQLSTASGAVQVSAPGGLAVVGGGALATTGPVSFSGAVSLTGSLSVSGYGITSTTQTFTPVLQPRTPSGGNFVLYVDAFDKALYVKGWLGTVTKLAKP